MHINVCLHTHTRTCIHARTRTHTLSLTHIHTHTGERQDKDGSLFKHLLQDSSIIAHAQRCGLILPSSSSSHNTTTHSVLPPRILTSTPVGGDGDGEEMGEEGGGRKKMYIEFGKDSFSLFPFPDDDLCYSTIQICLSCCITPRTSVIWHIARWLQIGAGGNWQAISSIGSLVH